VAVDLSLPADFTDALMSAVETLPTNTWSLSIKRNGATVGTITVSPAGVVTASTGSAPLYLAAGDVLKIVAPVSPDATASNMAFTFKGTKV